MQSAMVALVPSTSVARAFPRSGFVRRSQSGPPSAYRFWRLPDTRAKNPDWRPLGLEMQMGGCFGLRFRCALLELRPQNLVALLGDAWVPIHDS